jgi:hypothetical protein
MEASYIDHNAFGTYRDIDGQLVVKLYNPGSAITKATPKQWVLGTSGRDEAAAIVAGADVRQRVVVARQNVAASAWGEFVFDGPVQTREALSSGTSLMTITVPSGTYTAGNGLRVDPFSAALQDAGVPFDLTDESHIGEIVATATGTSIQARLHGRESIWRSKGDRKTKDLFKTRPTFVDDDGDGAPTGTTGDVNIMKTMEAEYEYCILGAGQTIVKPVWATTGVDVGLDQTADEGVEITQGISAISKVAFVVGTDSFYAKLKLRIADVSGTDDCAFGFRKAAAYTAAIDDYTDMAVLNVISSDIKIETILNDAATTTTDTTQNWLDTEAHTLEIYVSKAGVVTYKIDGAAPSVTAAFTFDSGDTLIPFFYFLNDTDLAGAVELVEWHAGVYSGS